MMDNFAVCLSFGALICCGFLSQTDATSCSSTINVCTATLRVTSTCSTSVCACAADTYSAVVTGCALTATIPTPTVTTVGDSIDGLYSGEVVATETLNLKCLTNGYTIVNGVTTFKWFSGGTEINSQTAQTYSFTAGNAAASVDITCQVLDSGLSSGVSTAFPVTTYVAGTALTIPPTISGLYSKVTTGTNMVLTCLHQPRDTSNAEIVWNDSSSSKTTTITVPGTVAGLNGQARTCTVQQKTGGTLGTAPAAASVTLPSAPYDKANIAAVEIWSPSAAVTIKEGEQIVIKCRVTDQTVLYKTDDATWAWDIGANAAAGTGILGEATPELTLPSSLAVGDHVVKCKANFGSELTASLTVSVSSTLIGGARVDVSPTVPILTGYMLIRCLIVAPSSTGMVYSWTKDNNRIAGQDDYTLQVNQVAAANDGVYKCTVTNSMYSVVGTSSSIAAVALSSITPTVSSNKVTTNFGQGSTYILSCDLSSTTPGMTYKWWNGGTLQAAQTSQTYSIVATTTSVNYKCQAVFTTLNSAESANFPVLGKAIASVSLAGQLSPVVGTSPSLACTVTTGATAAAATVQIKKDGTAVSSTSTHTIASIAAGTSDGTYTCEATVGSETLATTPGLTIAAVATPAVPIVSVSNGLTEINTGGSYTFTCTSASWDSTATFTWVKTSGGTDTTLGSTAMTYTIASAAAGDAGDYKCKITVNSVASAFSTPKTITIGATKGKPCTSLNYGSMCNDFTKYTGNCINSRCECKAGVNLYQDGCGTPASGDAPSLVASLITLALCGILFHTL